MSEHSAKLNFQDLPFLKLVGGFLLLVLTSTIVASGWLTGPSSRVEREPEIFQIVTSPGNLGGEFQYYRSITLNNPSPEEKTNVEVLLTIPTDSLIADGKMQSNCNDMRFTGDYDLVLDYWIESGCNTADTQVWIKMVTVPSGNSTIYMYYDDPAAASQELAWDQDSPLLVLPFSGECPNGWDPVVELNQDRFARGSTTYGSTGGGGNHHHYLSAKLESEDSVYKTSSASSGEAKRYHTHRFEGDTYSAEIIPPFVETVFCQLSLGADKRLPDRIPAEGIAYFTSLPDTTLWSRETSFDGKFAKGGDVPGAVGGSSTHQHLVIGNSTDHTASGDKGGSEQAGPGNSCTNTHSHEVYGYTDVKEVLPPYLDVIVASLDGDSLLPQDAIVASNFTSVPPLGWQQFSDLNNRFPRGGGIYGGVGGSEVHSHATSFDSNKPYGWYKSCGGGCNMYRCSRGDHRHKVVGTTDEQSSLPRYFDVIYVQKKADGLTKTYNNDETPVTPGPSPTSTPVPTGEPTPTPVPGSGVNLTVKFAGVTSRPVSDSDQTIKIWGESLDGSVALAAKASPLSVVFSVDDQGLYSGTLSLTEAQLDKHYRLVIKGPRHLGREFVDVVLSSGDLVLTAAGQELLPGDLNQDGLVNSVDVGIVNENFDLLVVNSAGDLDYDNYTKGSDKALILQTLSVRQDPR